MRVFQRNRANYTCIRLWLCLSVSFSALLLLGLLQPGWAQPDAASAASTILELKAKIKKDYNNAELHYLLGNAYAARLQLAAAREQYKICLELNPASKLADYCNRGLAGIEELSSGQSAEPEHGGKSGAATLSIVMGHPSQAPPGQPSPDSRPVAPCVSACDFKSAAPGTQIKISGVGFSPIPEANIVTIGTVTARVLQATPTVLRVDIPTEIKCPQYNCLILVEVYGAPDGASNVHIDITQDAVRSGWGE